MGDSDDQLPEAIAKGTSWTCPRAYGKPLKEFQCLNRDLRLGDVVFHQTGFVGAVSTVTAEWRVHPRPPEYAPRESEGDEGWLVSVRPIVTDLTLGLSKDWRAH